MRFLQLNGKNLSLLAGVFQQAALVLIIRYSKTRNQGGGSNDEGSEGRSTSIPYLTSVAVMSAEVFKLCLSYTLEIITTSQQAVLSQGVDSHDEENAKLLNATDSNPDSGSSSSPSSSKSLLKTMIKRSCSTLKQMLMINRESMKLIIPAVLYVIQNNLLFVALSNLSVPTYQVSNQGKLLTTSLISRVLLKKKMTMMQYVAIVLLGIGVAVVNLSEYKINMNSMQSESAGHEHHHQNQKLGFLAVFASCLTSGFAGVYFEFVLKTTEQSVHCRNFQLAFWSCLFAIIHIIHNDLEQVQSLGLFHGFDIIVILVVVAQAMTGFVVSMMLKYADAVLKGFAISVAVIVASVASIFFFHTKVNSMFFAGGTLVALSVKMYSYYGTRANSDKK